MPVQSESARLSALNSYTILDTPAEAGFDDIVRLASEICDAPVALVSFVGFDRQWFKARVGFDACETPLDQSVCSHVVAERRMIVIPDLTLDERSRANPLVSGPPFIRFYAGAPLETPTGEILGALCVIDVKPRPGGLSRRQATALTALARQVMTQLELRRLLRENTAQASQLAALQEEALAARTSERDRLWRISQDLLVTLDATGTFKSVSPVVTAILGWAPEEMVGRSVFDFVISDDTSITNVALEKATHDSLPIVENRYRHKDGGYRWMSWVAAPEGDLIFATGRHITEAKEAAQRLERVAADRDRIWRNSHDLIVVIDLMGSFTSVSPSAIEVLGWRPDELIGLNVRDFIHPDDQPPRLAGGGLDPERYRQESLFKNRYRNRDGSYRSISWSVTTDSALIYAYGRDITVEEERAEALRLSEEALRQSQKMEAVGQLTGGLAHDFNNLLTGITGSLDRIRVRTAQGRIDELERYIHAAQGAAQRAAALTHRLLAFSRRQTLDPKPVNVNRLVSELEELIRRTIGPAVTLEVVGAGGLWSTLADPNQLENALLNLCINGRDAMPGGGRITIETANKWLDDRASKQRDLPPGQYVSLCVTDTGTGMTPEVIARAFDPFFTTKPLGMGTGLGLSMIYGFARQSGGQVRIYSELGKGTTMCLYLPRHHGKEQDADPLPLGLPTAQAHQGETVLVVDDEPTVRMLIVEVLEEAGLTAIEAENGVAGLRILQSDIRIDLLVTDVGLPGGVNGRQMADAARLTRPDLKVLFITGYAENAVVGNGHLDPGMAVLTKPFTMEALASKVQEIIREI